VPKRLPARSLQSGQTLVREGDFAVRLVERLKKLYIKKEKRKELIVSDEVGAVGCRWYQM